MKPAGTAMYNNALVPYMNKKISSPAALKVIETELRGFMTKQVEKMIYNFYDITNEPLPRTIDDVPTTYIIPSFIISELKTAFQIGFLLYLPFLILDMVIASVLMAMGTVMLPPVIVSFPFKLLLFHSR